MSRPALLLIDLQNDYFPGGAMELANMTDAAANAAQLLAHFRQRQYPVFHIQHVAIRPGATFFLPDTKGVLIHESVKPQANEQVIIKNYPNSFRGTELAAALQQQSIEHLVISGAMSHMCIDTTTRAAFDLGYTCTLIHDACATKDLTFNHQTIPAAMVQATFMASLNNLFAKVTSCAEYSHDA